jgi:dienelactone hydrolase
MQAQIAIYSDDRPLMRARTQAGYNALLKNPMVDPAKVALIGYCFGGGVGVEFGSTGAPLVANVSIHGSFRDHHAGWARNAKGMYLILHGAEDQGFPLPVVDKVVQELRGAKVPFQLEVYSGTGHGFSTPRTRTRSAPTRSRSPRPDGHSRSFSASERSGQVREAIPWGGSLRNPPCVGRTVVKAEAHSPTQRSTRP